MGRSKMCGKKIRRRADKVAVKVSDKTSGTPSPPSPPSLIDLPNDMLLEIMKRVAHDSYTSFINAKATCKAMQAVGEEYEVLKRVNLKQLPLFIDDEYPHVGRVVNAASAAGNSRALFRLGIAHCLCAGGNYEYGCHLIANAASKRLHRAVYIYSLLLTTQSGMNNHNYESLAIEAWKNICAEDRIQRIRHRMEAWFPRLVERLMGGPVFRVTHYTCCGIHSPTDRLPQSCVRCRLDIELQWFVESLGGTYIVAL